MSKRTYTIELTEDEYRVMSTVFGRIVHAEYKDEKQEREKKMRNKRITQKVYSMAELGIMATPKSLARYANITTDEAKEYIEKYKDNITMFGAKIMTLKENKKATK